MSAPVYVVFEVEVLDPGSSGYADYRAAVRPMIEQAGGRYLARAAPGTALEGRGTNGVWHLVEFPDARTAQDFWASPEYAALKPLREGAADVRAVLVEPSDD